MRMYITFFRDSANGVTCVCDNRVALYITTNDIYVDDLNNVI